MESMREQGAFTQHALVTRSKLDLRDGERVSQMQATIHIWVRERPEPFRVFLAYLRG